MSSALLDKTLGIIGGGQLGKMLLSECNKMNIKTHILDLNEDSPCKKMTNKFYCGDFKDFDTVLSFGKECDLITFEIEHINVDALEKLEKLGKKVYPSSETLKIIQDKNKQKCFFKEHDIPSADFKYFNNLDDLHKSINNHDINFPCVWKKTKFGYDGFGVKILKNEKDLIELPNSEMIIEDLVVFKKELAVIVAMNKNRDIKTYETVEMEFNPDSNQVEFVISPANISEKVNTIAKKIASDLAKKINLVGLLAVEMFLTPDEKILINEIAPRPHNSGHFSIDACPTSQFKQHINSITNRELGETSHENCAIMINLVGEESYNGLVKYENIDLIKDQKSVFVHIYGKKMTRPNRKMGHVTVICDNFDEAYIKAKEIKDIIKVKSY